MLVVGWLLAPGAAWVWTMAALTALAVPALIGSLTPLARGARRKVARCGGKQPVPCEMGCGVGFSPSPFCLLKPSRCSMRSSRACSSHHHRRRLLEWLTAARSAQREAAAGSRGRTWRFMLSAVLLAATIGILVLWFRPGSLLVAFRCCSAGLWRPRSPCASARRSGALPSPSQRHRTSPCANWRGAPGCFSRTLSGRMIIGCPQTTTKKRRSAKSRRILRPPTSAASALHARRLRPGVHRHHQSCVPAACDL